MSRLQCGGQTPPGKQHHAGKLRAEKETDTIRDLFVQGRSIHILSCTVGIITPNLQARKLSLQQLSEALRIGILLLLNVPSGHVIRV